MLLYRTSFKYAIKCYLEILTVFALILESA